jgi:peptide-methionine (S)-S-oxide reductase
LYARSVELFLEHTMTDATISQSLQTLTLGGGCFWCLDAVYRRVRGVVAVESGYCNGHVLRPSYEQVCRGDTGHVEVVRLQFDPATIGVQELLEIFFTIHDPTTPNRQGNDVGPQYRSGIYHEDPQHAEAARAFVRRLEQDRSFGAPIVTEVLPLANYSRAEDYHQDYFAQHPNQGYCSFVVGPKVEKFRKTFVRFLK